LSRGAAAARVADRGGGGHSVAAVGSRARRRGDGPSGIGAAGPAQRGRGDRVVGTRAERRPRHLARGRDAGPGCAGAHPAGAALARHSPRRLGARRSAARRHRSGQRPAVRPGGHTRLEHLVRAGLLGTVSAGTAEPLLYLAPGADSLAAAWARILEPLVRPTDSLPAALRSQLPYPRQAFRIAAALLAPPRPDSIAWQPRPRE